MTRFSPIVLVLIGLLFSGCGGGTDQTDRFQQSLSGTYQSKETALSICMTGTQMELPKLTVTFQANSLCRHQGCSDVITCPSFDSGTPLEVMLANIGSNCTLSSDGGEIHCDGLTLVKIP